MFLRALRVFFVPFVSMNPSLADRICQAYGLGRLTASPQEAPGVRNKIWRIQTDRGSFAVKQIASEEWRSSEGRHAHRMSCRISSAMAAAHVPTITAISASTGPIQTFDGLVVTVSPWVEGEVLTVEAVSVDRARLVGALLAQIHALWLDIPDAPQPERLTFVPEEWQRLVQGGIDQRTPWAGDLQRALPQVIEWSATYESTCERLNGVVVLTHRDLFQRNVLWQDPQTPIIVDWERSGLMNPTLELAHVAFCWGGLMTLHVEAEVVRSLIESYVHAGGTARDSGRDALYGCLGNWLRWLKLNMSWSVGQNVPSAEQQRVATQNAGQILQSVRWFVSNFETWAQWLDVPSRNEPHS